MQRSRFTRGNIRLCLLEGSWTTRAGDPEQGDVRERTVSIDGFLRLFSTVDILVRHSTPSKPWTSIQ